MNKQNTKYPCGQLQNEPVPECEPYYIVNTNEKANYIATKYQNEGRQQVILIIQNLLNESKEIVLQGQQVKDIQKGYELGLQKVLESIKSQYPNTKY